MEPDVPRKTTSRSTAPDSSRALKVSPLQADKEKMPRKRAYRSSGLLRSLTLLRTFLIASAVILAAGAVALSSTLSNDLRKSALDDNAHDVGAYVDAVLAPTIVRGDRVLVTARALRRLTLAVRLPEDVRGLNVYSREGRLLFSTTQPGRVGRRRSSPDLTPGSRLQPSSTRKGRLLPSSRSGRPSPQPRENPWARPRWRSTVTW
jgi:hypothetical protein